MIHRQEGVGVSGDRDDLEPTADRRERSAGNATGDFVAHSPPEKMIGQVAAGVDLGHGPTCRPLPVSWGSDVDADAAYRSGRPGGRLPGGRTVQSKRRRRVLNCA